MDLFVPDDFNEGHPYELGPGLGVAIPSGLRLEIPNDHAVVLVMENRSGVAIKQSLLVGATIVDQDYRGELHLHILNVSNEIKVITPGQRLTQLVMYPIIIPELEEVDDISIESTRAENGLGSTGV